MVLSVVPSALEAFTAANTGAAATISAAGSADSAAIPSDAAAALGPIGEIHLAAYGLAQASNLAGTLFGGRCARGDRWGDGSIEHVVCRHGQRVRLATAVVPQPTPVSPPASVPSIGSVSPTGQLAQALPGFDPEPAINAQEASLADYLNQHVQDILARLGLSRLPGAAPPPGAPRAETAAGPANPSAAPPPGAPNTAIHSHAGPMAKSAQQEQIDRLIADDIAILREFRCD
jgi:hypothetical protein